MSDEDAALRRRNVLTAARWCFLNFGFAKTAIDDIAKRAGLSRTLIYRLFKDKEAIYQAVFVDWLLSRLPAARRIAEAPDAPRERLLDLCRLMVIEPWSEMAGTPMGAEFLAICERVDPDGEALYRRHMGDAVAAVLGDAAGAEVFLLALDGLVADQPSAAALDRRVRILAERFASPPAEGLPS